MEQLEKERLRELVRDYDWRSRMLASLVMTELKDREELDEDEVDMLVDHLCSLKDVQPPPAPKPEEKAEPLFSEGEMELILRAYLKQEEDRMAADLTFDMDAAPTRTAPPRPEPEGAEEPEEEESLGGYAPWRKWEPEQWCRFLKDTGVDERRSRRSERLCDQFDELLGAMKKEQRRRERRRKLALWTVVWIVLLQLGGICCGIVWRISTALGRLLSLPSWMACGLLGLLAVLAVLAVCAAGEGLKKAKNSLNDLFFEDDDDDWYWEDDEEA